jgi:hypothetical protein
MRFAIRVGILGALVAVLATAHGIRSGWAKSSPPPAASSSASAAASTTVRLQPSKVQGGDPSYKTARKFERGPDYSFVRDTKAKITKTRVNQPGSGAGIVSPDGSTYFMDAKRNGTYGGVLISKTSPQGVFYPTPEVNNFAFSPSGKYLAVVDDEDKSVAVLSVPQGKLVRKFNDAYAARFRDDGVLLYRSHCQLYEFDPNVKADPRPVGPRLCGGAHASNNGNIWIVVEPTTYPYVRSYESFKKLTVIDGISGEATPIPVNFSFAQAGVSAAGKRVCYWIDAYLYCRELATAKIDTFDSVKVGRLAWERADNLMLAPTKSDVIIADFDRHTIRKVVSVEAIRFFNFLPGASRVYLYDKGANLFDLDTGVSFEIFDKKEEVVGFAVVPNRMDRFLSGKFTKSDRDPHWIDVKPSATRPEATPAKSSGAAATTTTAGKTSTPKSQTTQK